VFPVRIRLARQLPFTSVDAAANHSRAEEDAMLYYSLMFLLVGLVAGALGLFGVAAVASQIAWILFLVGVILLVIHVVTGRSTRTL
jgi:uncharacterized membrane protein YtjA (UPF0391 family)